MTRKARRVDLLALKYACPACGAKRGKPCWRSNRPHVERRDKARAANNQPEVKVTYADGSIETRPHQSFPVKGRPGAKARHAAILSVARDRARQKDDARQHELKAAFLARQAAREATAETPRES